MPSLTKNQPHFFSEYQSSLGLGLLKTFYIVTSKYPSVFIYFTQNLNLILIMEKTRNELRQLKKQLSVLHVERVDLVAAGYVNGINCFTQVQLATLHELEVKIAKIKQTLSTMQAKCKEINKILDLTKTNTSLSRSSKDLLSQSKPGRMNHSSGC